MDLRHEPQVCVSRTVQLGRSGGVVPPLGGWHPGSGATRELRMGTEATRAIPVPSVSPGIGLDDLYAQSSSDALGSPAPFGQTPVVATSDVWSHGRYGTDSIADRHCFGPFTVPGANAGPVLVYGTGSTAAAALADAQTKCERVPALLQREPGAPALAVKCGRCTMAVLSEVMEVACDIGPISRIPGFGGSGCSMPTGTVTIPNPLGGGTLTVSLTPPTNVLYVGHSWWSGHVFVAFLVAKSDSSMKFKVECSCPRWSHPGL